MVSLRFRGGVTSGSDEYVLDYDDRFSFNQDSVFGLQVSKDLDEKVNVVGQAIFRGKNNFSSEMEWAYATYRLAQQTTLKIGKFRVPFYEYSDSLDVAYSYHWIRPPIEGYFIPLTSVSGGVLVSQDWSWDEWHGNSKFLYGGSNEKMAIPGPSLSHDKANIFDVDLNDLLFFTSSISYGYVRFRASYGVASDLSAVNEKTEMIRNAYPKDIADDVLFENKSAKFMGCGVFLENDRWFVGGELIKLDWERSILISDQRAFYVTGGIKQGNSTIHLTYSTVSSNTEKFSYGPPIPDKSTPWDQSSWTIGWRYDLTESSAIKFEYAMYIDDYQRGIAGNPLNSGGDKYDERPSLFSAAWDIVF